MTLTPGVMILFLYTTQNLFQGSGDKATIEHYEAERDSIVQVSYLFNSLPKTFNAFTNTGIVHV